MERRLVQKLVEWKSRRTRHPLILRGARQVGKTYLVRELAKREFSYFLELNFEEDSTLSGLFKTKDPSVICELLLVKYTIPIVDGKTLLFLDELQAAEPFVLESLRYFFEKRPGPKGNSRPFCPPTGMIFRNMARRPRQRDCGRSLPPCRLLSAEK